MLATLATSVAIATLAASGSPAEGTLFVSGYTPNAVFRYDAVPGDFIGTLDPAGGTMGPLGVTRGPDGRVYVASELTDSILRFEAATGDFVDAFVPAGRGGLNEPAGLVFGPDRTDDDVDDLYVSSFVGDSILVFDGADGAFVEVFVASGSGGLNGPDAGIAFGPDGNLYVPSYWSNQVLRYDGATGAFIDVFIPHGTGGLARPRTILFPPDGTVLVSAESTDRVVRCDAATGAFIDVPITVGGPTGLALDSAGWLYVASIDDNAVYRYDGSGGDPETVVAAGAGGLATPTFVLLIEACVADIDGSGTVDVADLVALLAAWGPCKGCPEDVDGDDTVGTSDLIELLAGWGACP
jgi:DNA-binding beta-propeller fold protein YncE